MKTSAGFSPASQKSFADELEQRVAERTAELTTANEQLRKELAEHERVEEALREGEFNLDLIVESIPVPVAVTSPSGEVEALNKPTLEYFGRTFEELKGWKSSDVVHPDDLQRTIAAQVEAHQTGTAYNVESRHRRSDGVYRWFNVLGLPLRDSQGRIRHWFHLQIDIDDRKRAEAQLAGEKRLLEMVASGHALTDVLTELCKFVEETAGDCKCGIYLINWRTATFRLGAAPNLPATFNDPVDGLTVTSDAGPCGLAALTKSQVLTTDIDADPRFQTATIRPLLLAHGLRSHWSTPIYSRNGQVFGTFAIFQDLPSSPTQLQQDLISQVTHIASIAIERALSEAALKRSEAFLAEAQQLSRIGSFSWRVATDEITWSEQLYRIYELDPTMPVTLELIRTRVHPEDLTLYEKMVEQARNGADDFEWQYRLLMPDQSIKYMHAVAQATQDQNGQLEYIAAVQDVSTRRQSEEALDKARSELAHVARAMTLGALTASIAHEVNQPLSGIITNASTCVRMLDADPPNVNGARETAKRTIRDGHRAADVITRLRALFTHKEVAMELIDLNEATREVIALSRSELERNRVITRTQLANELPLVTGDRVQVQQVILNLLRNGSDAMSAVDDRPRELWLRTERDGDRVRLSVKDAGIGFEPQSLDRLFQTFYTTKDDGMGIGLSVSRSIIENHGGRLWATPNDGPGVTFSFSIPCIDDAGDSRSKNDDNINEQ
jgi:PAS domain S-box-containing protein